MTTERCPRCGAEIYPGCKRNYLCGSGWLIGDSFRQSDRCRAAELEAENKRLKLCIQSAAGDDLCRLTQEEIKAYTSGAVKIPPKEEFIPSCERFHEQIASEVGVLTNCLTLAQLVAENERLRDELQKQTVWADEATPFSPSQIKDLLAENQRLRTELEGKNAMSKKVKIEGTPARRIEVEGTPQRKISPEEFCAALGAEPIEGSIDRSKCDEAPHSLLDAAVAQRTEECAKVAEEHGDQTNKDQWTITHTMAGIRIAAKIRELNKPEAT